MKISNQLVMLEIKSPVPVLYPLLIWDEQNLVLIDAGFPQQLELFREAIAAEGFPLERLTHILLTHQDMDHIGCLRELLALAPNAVVMAHKDEAPSIRGDVPPSKVVAMAKQQEQTPEAQVKLEERIASYTNYTARVDHELQDGEIIPICGGIEVIHTPGHTLGHICFYIRRDKVLMTGDTIGIKEGALTGAVPMHTPDMALAAKSNRKLERVPAEVLVAYHGGLFRGNVPGAIAALAQA